MNNNRPRRTWDQSGKPGAIIDVLSYLMEQGYETRQRCVDDDAYARKLFEDPELGNISVPNEVRLVFVQEGDQEKGDKGSVVIELPRPTTMPARPNVMCYPKEPMDQPREWDRFGKCAAITDVILHLMANPHLGSTCLTNDSFVRYLFETVGTLQIPREVKAVFVPAGEQESGEFGSLVIELPPIGEAPHNQQEAQELLQYVLCCYSLWAP